MDVASRIWAVYCVLVLIIASVLFAAVVAYAGWFLLELL